MAYKFKLRIIKRSNPPHACFNTGSINNRFIITRSTPSPHVLQHRVHQQQVHPQRSSPM